MVQAKQVQRVHVQNDAAMHCLFGGDVRIKHSAFTALISKFRLNRTLTERSTQDQRKLDANSLRTRVSFKVLLGFNEAFCLTFLDSGLSIS